MKQETISGVLPKLKGEMSGAFFVGLIEAFRTTLALSSHVKVGGIRLDELDPEKWYPHQMFYDLLQYIARELSPAPSIYFMAGVNFIRNWYEHGPGKELISCSRDWLLSQTDTSGYNTVVRGGTHEEIGNSSIIEYDEQKGIVVYDIVCAIPMEYLRGIFWGGCFLFDDLDYYDVSIEKMPTSPHPYLEHTVLTVRFRMRFEDNLNEKVTRLIEKHTAREPLDTDAATLDSLIWRYRHLLRKHETEVSYRKDLHGLLVKTLEESNKLRKAAEAANRAKSEFLANMSHEIRTPMNAVLGYAEILRSKELDTKKKHYVDSIYSAGQTLLSLINDVLDLSKIESGKLELSYSALSLRFMGQEMETIFSKRAQDKGLNFSVEIHEPVPDALVLDELRLRQILINLIGNALKFTEEGYIRLSFIAVPTVTKSHSRVELTIEVRDTGMGIPADKQKTIFGAFEQAHKSNTGLKGTGLGLAISNRLVEMMQGEMSVESEVGKGSVFRVGLHGVEIAAGISKQERQGQSEKIDFEAATILIADDIDYNREILTTFLEGQPFTLFYAENGLQAIEQAIKYQPDLILLDMKMPEMDGYEASSKLKSKDETKNIPIIAITASALKQDEERIRETCDGYLRKPVNPIVLINELKRFLPYQIKEESSAKPESESKPPISLTEDNKINQELASLPEEWRKRALIEARSGHADRLEMLRQEIKDDFPAVSETILQHLSGYRFDLLVAMLSGDHTEEV